MNNQLAIIDSQCTMLGDMECKLNIYGTYEEPLFIGTEVATLLGYKNPRSTIYRFVDPNDKQVVSNIALEPVSSQDTGSNLSKHTSTITLINEYGLYELIMRSSLPQAQKFKTWIKDVIKTIRLHGKYEIEEKLEQKLEAEREHLQVEYDTIIEEKEKEIKNLLARRYLKQEKTYPLHKRLIYLEYFTETEYRELNKNLSTKPRLIMYHRGRDEFKDHLRRLGRIISRERGHRYGKCPNISRSNRVNIMRESEYLHWGDDLIKEYMKEHPRCVWGITDLENDDSDTESSETLESEYSSSDIDSDEEYVFMRQRDIRDYMQLAPRSQ